MEAIGTHCILELYGCPRELLDDESAVKDALREAVRRGMATLLHEVSHHFHPQGVTVLGLIAESHVAIHTWPECGYAAVDVFTCGDQARAEDACLYLAGALRAGRHVLKKLHRGFGAPGKPALPQANAACPSRGREPAETLDRRLAPAARMGAIGPVRAAGASPRRRLTAGLRRRLG